MTNVFKSAAHIIIPWFLSSLHFLTSLCKLYCLFGRPYFQINPLIWIVPNDLNDNKPISVQIKVCRLLDTKPLCEAMLAYFTGQYMRQTRVCKRWYQGHIMISLQKFYLILGSFSYHAPEPRNILLSIYPDKACLHWFLLLLFYCRLTGSTITKSISSGVWKYILS